MISSPAASTTWNSSNRATSLSDAREHDEERALNSLGARRAVGIALATVKTVADDDIVIVEVDGLDARVQPCDVLQTHEHDRLVCEPGDKVLVAGAGSLPRGVILAASAVHALSRS